MEKRFEESDPASCFRTAGGDELLFVLMERDRAAVPAVMAWIEERLRLGLNAPKDKQITEANAWCEAANWEAAKRAAGRKMGA